MVAIIGLFVPFDAFKGTGSVTGGLRAGYTVALPSRFVLGVEADLSAPDTFAGTQAFAAPAAGVAALNDMVVEQGTVRGRFGRTFGDWLAYGTGGLAWSYDRLTRAQVAGTAGSAVPGTAEQALLWRFSFAAGAGVEVPLADNWTARLEYLYAGYPAVTAAAFPAAAQRIGSDLAVQSLRVGVDYRLSLDPGKRGVFAAPEALDLDAFSVHGQTTFVSQYAAPSARPTAARRASPPIAGARPGTSTSTSAGGRGRAANCGSTPRSIRASACRGPSASPVSRARRPTRSAPTSPTRACRGCSSARPSTSAATPRRSHPISTSSPARTRPTGWC